MMSIGAKSDEMRPCAFCGFEIPTATKRGRPARYCSTSCRQADYRERHHQVRGGPYRRRRRRYENRVEAELRRLIDVEGLTRFHAMDRAMTEAAAAWPHISSPAIARDINRRIEALQRG